MFAAPAFVALALILPARSFGLTQTTTTTYQYNADGAATAVTTQVGSGTASTVYLTWDNFVPSTADPTTGTVSAGNGNLLGFGSQPGSAYTTQFQFDPRNRLTGASASGAQSVSYTYHPASLMAASTLGSGDALDFYYNSASLPRVANISQPSTGKWTSYLASNTYISDGTEQLRCQQRKDVNGIYKAAQQSFSPLRYDPFGSTANATASGPAEGASTYDLTQNPFQYNGEYKDPAWSGYYFRARWYLPQYQTFISRDPEDRMQRYSYAGGNPISNHDPSGYSYAQFSRGVNKFLRPMTRGALGYTLPFIPIYGQVVGGLQLLANLPAAWHHPTNARAIASYIFLAASIATEIADAHPLIDKELAFRAGGSRIAFGGRLGADIGIGIGQTILSGYRGHGKWDVHAIGESIAYNASGIFWGRYAAGFGYRTHVLNEADVDAIFNAYRNTSSTDNEVLVFKMRRQAAGTKSFTTPWMEAHDIGVYHEALLITGKDRRFLSEVTVDDAGVAKANLNWVTADRPNRYFYQEPNTKWMREIQNGRKGEASFEFVGRASRDKVTAAMATSVPDMSGPTGYDAVDYDYSMIHNNCQDHVTRMLDAIREP